jgi:hypothetical protein
VHLQCGFPIGKMLAPPLILFDAVHFKMSRAKKGRERKERARLYELGLKPYDLTRLPAFHEAGHVVFSTFHGNPVEIVTIDMQRVETRVRGCRHRAHDDDSRPDLRSNAGQWRRNQSKRK